MYLHPSLNAWTKVTVDTAPINSSVAIWVPPEVAGDCDRQNEIIGLMVGSFVVGVVGRKPTPEKVSNRKNWGQRLGGGQEGSVYRLNSSPSHVAKIFKVGRGTNLEYVNGIEGHRAGRSALAHNMLSGLLDDDPIVSCPRSYAVGVHVPSRVAITLLDYVEGVSVDDVTASEIHKRLDENLSSKGLIDSVRAEILHDIRSNGGNVIENGDPNQHTLFPTYSVIDR